MDHNLDKDSAKILVLGDSGVGKSSLIHLICHSSTLSSTQWTIGCSIDVKLHDNHFLEFWDIGGSRGHKLARSFLYQNYHGIILVFDATNKKSRLNLSEWLVEVQRNDRDPDIPLLTIATKKDLKNDKWENQVLYVNTQDPFSFDQDTKNYRILDNFLKRVIVRRDNKL